jgi:hypothetical protein
MSSLAALVPAGANASTYSHTRVCSGARGDDTLMAGAHTSCPFARSTYHALLQSNRVVSAGQHFTLYAYSRVTHRWYAMHCSVDWSKVTCRGGNNARVLIYYGS